MSFYKSKEGHPAHPPPQGGRSFSHSLSLCLSLLLSFLPTVRIVSHSFTNKSINITSYLCISVHLGFVCLSQCRLLSSISICVVIKRSTPPPEDLTWRTVSSDRCHCISVPSEGSYLRFILLQNHGFSTIQNY